MQAINRVGVTHGRLTVIKQEKCKGRTYYISKCVCGKTVGVNGSNWKRVRSCGCFRRDWARENAQTHMMSKTPIWNRWMSMKNRCSLKGGRYNSMGIKVSARWESFAEFYKDMHQSFQQHVSIHGEKQTTLDRINNSKGYSKKNCRWATLKQQARNRSIRREFVVDGVSATVAEHSEKYGKDRNEVWSRVNRGWDIKAALSGKRNL